MTDRPFVLPRSFPPPTSRRPPYLVPVDRYRCRRCGTSVFPRPDAHAVAWCATCQRVGVARVSAPR